MVLSEAWWLLIAGVALLALAAIGGYLTGRKRLRRIGAELWGRRGEIDRAMSVIDELEGVAERLRRAISQHDGATRRFTSRLTNYERTPKFSHHDLCDRAEEMLKHANRLTAEISNAYASLLQQTTHLSMFAELRADPLTGAANRQAVDETLGDLLAVQTRHSLPVTLVLVDVDFFKQLNDARSVLQGDRVLIELVAVLRSLVRPCDLLGRYGGEKFAIVMPQTEASVAAEMVETMRRAIQARTVVTVSAGLADSAHGDTCSTLFNRAETALAKAKGAGRNCVYLHEGTMGHIVGVQPRMSAAKTATLAKTLADASHCRAETAVGQPAAVGN
jgi:diguanylate cyclase (GGDEF)-like protein